MKTADKILAEMLEIFNARGKEYGTNYTLIGGLLQELYPDGITIKTIAEHNAFHIFTMILLKATRLAKTNLTHKDSALDLALYAAILAGMVDNENPTEN